VLVYVLMWGEDKPPERLPVWEKQLDLSSKLAQ